MVTPNNSDDAPPPYVPEGPVSEQSPPPIDQKSLLDPPAYTKTSSTTHGSLLFRLNPKNPYINPLADISSYPYYYISSPLSINRANLKLHGPSPNAHLDNNSPKIGHLIYKICEALGQPASSGEGEKSTIISQFYPKRGIMVLRKTRRIVKSRSGCFRQRKERVEPWEGGWEVVRLESIDDVESSGTSVLLATPLGNSLEWRNPSGCLVAISSTSSTADEVLEIVKGVGMENSQVDAIVAIWISRLWREGRDLCYMKDQKKEKQA